MFKRIFYTLSLFLLVVTAIQPVSVFASSGSGQVKLYGTIEQLPAGTLVGDWTVSGRIVHVTATTRVEQKKGPAVVGAYVEVKGYTEADGTFTATKIEVKNGTFTATKIEVKKGRSENKFYGYIESLPAGTLIGDWTVSGRIVHVTATTRIEQKKRPAVVGAYVEVKGYPEADGTFTATKIEVKR